MKILFISNILPPHLRGGYELGALDIAKAFHSAGCHVTFATSKTLGALRKTDRPNLPFQVHEIFEPIYVYEELRTLDCSYVWKRSHREPALGGVVASNCVALTNLLDQESYDTVWIFNPLGLGPVGILETALCGSSRVVVHLMDNIDGVIRDHQTTGPYFAPRFARLKQSCIGVSCSEKTRRENSVLGKYGEHLVIPNGISFAKLPSHRPKPYRKGETFRMVYFGQIEPHKGIDGLVDACAGLAKAGRCNISLDLFGKGSADYRETLAKRVCAAGLNDIVHFQGQKPKQELMNCLSDYHAAVMLVGVQEPFGYAMLEAIGCGLPLVTTAGTGFSEVMPAEYPFYVRSSSHTTEVIKHLASIMDDHSSALKIVADAATFARARCDFDESILPEMLKISTSPIPRAKAFDEDSVLAAYYGSVFTALA